MAITCRLKLYPAGEPTTAEANHTALVLGHHHPHTDAVCSAPAYASFYRWQTGRDAIPCYLDDLAPETARLLTYLGLGTPRATA